MVESPNEGETNALRERVANAIFQAQRKREIERISNITFDKRSFDQAIDKILTSEPEISILTGWALISTHIDRAVRHHVSHGTNRETEDFFSGFGPLSTDAGKIKLAKLMGWLPKELFDALSFVRTTRNKIAHDLLAPTEVMQLMSFPRTKFGFADQTILRAFSALTAAETDVKDGVDFVNSLDELQYAQICMVILASYAFESILNGPGALALGVDIMGGPLYNYNEAPDWAKSLRLLTADAILRIIPITYVS